MTECLFCKIAAKTIPAAIVFENDDVIAFLDIKPVQPGHVLVIPKKHSDNYLEADPVDVQAMMDCAQRVARALIACGADGANVSTNIKPAGGQVIFHTHVHVVPRKTGDGLKLWPGKDYAAGEQSLWAEKIKQSFK